MTAVGKALTVIFTVWVVLPHALVAVMVYAVLGELTKGVPDIVPVVLLKLNPEGRAGFMEYDIGVVPDTELTVLSAIAELTQVLIEEEE